MRRPQQRLAGAAIALALPLLGGAACGPEPGRAAAAVPSPAEERLVVAVTVAPLAWLAEGVGGARVETAVMIPPGHEPHAYEPRPREMAALDRAHAYVAVGHPQLAFETRHVEPALAARPEVAVVRLAEPGAAGGDDPHLWLSPARMRAAAAALAAALQRIDLRHAAGYRERLAAVEARIDAADREAAALLAGLPHRRFLVYHPAWGAFAEHYRLEQVAIEADGKEPGPRELARRIEAARAAGMRTVFVQRGFAERPARVVAAELGARVVALDPLARGWDANLVAAAGEIARELARPAEAAPAREASR